MTGASLKRDKNHEASIVYVPSIDDFQVTEFGAKKGFHMPVWLLDIIIADGLFDSGKLRTRDNSEVRWANDSECSEMLRAYEIRKGREDEDTELLNSIKDEYKNMRIKERAKNLNNSRSHSATESRFEKERIMAQVVAQAKADEKIEEAKIEEQLEVKKVKVKN